MQLIDTHSHIYSKQFNGDLSAALQRAREVGVQKILMPNVDSESIEAMLNVETNYPDLCMPMMGLHPCSVNDKVENELRIAEDWFHKRDFVAVGEMGIDLYWDKTFIVQQREAFRVQAAWAKAKKLPLVIHSRDAMHEVLTLLEELHSPDLFGVLHCFTGTVDDAKRLIDLNFHVGIGGVATYKNGGLDQVLPHVPLDRIVLETDSPYLAPVPYRGKRNESSYVALVAQKVADIYGTEVEKIAEKTTQNAAKLFGIF